jgi:chromosome segregation ATPase
LAVGIAGVLATVMFHLLRGFEARTRRDMDQLAEERSLFEQDMRAREYELQRRQEALNRRAVATSIRLASYAKSVDDTRTENRALRERILELEAEIDEVNDERNQLISNELTLASAQFTARAYGDLRAVAGGEQPARMRRSGKRGVELFEHERR